MVRRVRTDEGAKLPHNLTLHARVAHLDMRTSARAMQQARRRESCAQTVHRLVRWCRR